MTLAEAPTIASVSTQLEQSPHYLRIKKLLIFTCTGTWETHPDRLAAIDVRDLVAQTLEARPTMRELRPTLENLVRSLNKPVEYLPVAETILRSIAALYPDEDPTEWFRTQAPRPQTAVLPPQEWFDLRLELVNRTNPLRIKIIIAKTLRQGEVTPTAPWLTVKGLELERLLPDLLLACPDYGELCQRLETVAMQLEEPEEYQQVVGTLLEVLEPVYQRLQKLQTISDADVPAWSPPAEDEPAIVVGPELLPAETALVDNTPVPADLEIEPVTPEAPLEPVVMPVPGVEPARVSDLFQQELQELSTEAELRRLVSTAVHQVIGDMEQVFRTLEADLETATRHLPPTTRYRYLREFVTQVQDMADRFAQILHRLEQRGQ
ncbi:hypothetical protein [Gloeomargarita lithophora]|nr:hypothetical protein [Gloeomargarita lithophora]